MGAVVGIDLGTTNTVVAAARDGRVAALPDESGSTLIPSIVSFLPSGAVLVGNAAKERRSEDALNTIYSVKRLIGRTWDSLEVQQARQRFAFEMREGPGRATFVVARGETYTLPEISAFVLRKAKSIAELELGEPVDRAVITVPASFNDLQRAATKVAGRVAGLEVLRILNEPTAAALAYGHTRGNRERIAVYDFGGGTFDLTLLLLTDDVFEVLGTSGDTFLGGDDIDSVIVERMMLQIGLPASPKPQPEHLERLRAAAELVKHQLTDAPSVTIRLEEREVGASRGFDFTLTRDELDALVAPIADRTFEVCRDALSTARLTPKDIDHVLLVGGTTRIPLVRQKVERYFGRRARADLDPHEVVALGAAQQAMALTQLRATASGMPLAPPTHAVTAASSKESPASPTHVGATLPDVSSPKTEPYGDLRQRTDSGIGVGDEASNVGRVSVVPPEGPLSKPVPTTQNFGTRDRRTTGVGLGPMPEGLPLVGVDAGTKARNATDPNVPPSTLDGVGPTFGVTAKRRAADESRPMRDAEPLPIVTPTARRDAETSATATGSPLAKSPRETIPDAVVPWGEPSSAATELDLPVVQATPHSSLGKPQGKAVASRVDPATDLPLVVSTAKHHGATKARVESSANPAIPLAPSSASTNSAFSQPTGATHLGLPDPDDDGADEPTVVRRSLTSEHEVASATPDTGDSDWPDVAADNRDSALGLPAIAEIDLESAVSSSTPRGRKPSSLNEAEIRARYGDLPLIVGGRRVGGHPTEPAFGAVGRAPSRPPEPPQPEVAPSRPEIPRVDEVALPRITTEVSTYAAPQSLSGSALDVRGGTPASLDKAQKTAHTELVASAPRASKDTAASTGTGAIAVTPGIAAASGGRAVVPSKLAAPGAARPAPAMPPIYSLNPNDLEPDAMDQAPFELEIGRPNRGAARVGTGSFDASLGSPESQPTSSSRANSAIGASDGDAESATPKSQRLHSTRPAARQEAAVEFELPVPDLPPSRSESAPVRPGLAGTQVIPSPIQVPEPFAGKARAPEPATPHQVMAPAKTQAIGASPARGANFGSAALNATLPLGASTFAVGTQGSPPGSTQSPAVQAPTPPQQNRTLELPSLLGTLPATPSQRPALLIDVTPLSLCVETVGGYVDTLIARNTPVPCERTRDFVTAHDDQVMVIVRVAQGESKQFGENALLGELQLTGLRPAPRGQSRIAVTFGIDSDGILHVRALDTATGQSANADLRLTGAPTSPEVAQMIARHAAKGHA